MGYSLEWYIVRENGTVDGLSGGSGTPMWIQGLINFIVQ